MKIKSLKFILGLIAVTAVFIACEKDDDTVSSTFVEEDRTIQQAKDNDSILNYLQTHYYNSSFFETGTNHKYTDIEITALSEGESVPEGHTLLMDAVGEPITYNFLDVDYEYYILKLNQGGGDAPNFTDQVRVRYEGTSINSDEIFDVASSPQDFFLVGNRGSVPGTIKAWQIALPQFNSALDFSFDGNGGVDFNNFGLGVMFVPSGLGYFSQSRTGSAYDNLMFKFELLQYEEVDHDGDGVPSYLEDLNGDLDPFNDDTDENTIPDYLDFDDDGDGVPTLFEDIDGDGDPTNDIGVNGIPKYLDPEETESNQV
jgi:hypothetical protein